MVSQDDEFDALLMQEDALQHAGAVAGEDAGRLAGIAEGRQLGLVKGTQLGAEVGYMRGVAAALLELSPTNAAPVQVQVPAGSSDAAAATDASASTESSGDDDTRSTSPTRPAGLSMRTRKAAEAVIALADGCSLENPHEDKLFETLDRLRAKFKQLTSAAGLNLRFDSSRPHSHDASTGAIVQAPQTAASRVQPPATSMW
ncbi:hypothetical protein CAOG_01902 [Capsaspora owczarzaki ATCC 30864]|uniref:hypothetical protein n=1 Tax=Capsaspora owczarzaki (strain ATCC 30864) TaxID=595528 RepID=UPI0003522BA8|nr:hypothetical protein CAOG_01902 [Capsaspora owczarzaki ATCC 30864]|eukprot:XP_004364770.2 hypothetical protein CAOG_01902 [Capsaspora owczarzaki ATCC 30864]